MTWTAPDVVRVDEPFVAGERAMLDGFLEWQRASLLLKCAGLTGEQLVRRASPPSGLSLLGLVRHLTEVERTWFRARFGGQEPPDASGRAFDDLDPAAAPGELAALREEQRLAREAVAGLSLEHEFVSPRWGRMQLRWAYSHMIAEYARHCGHADLIREAIDGVTGA